jgi:DNA recombination protein RmuC
MTATILAVLTLLSFILVLLVVLVKRNVASPAEQDISPVLNSISALQKGQEVADRSVREELARSRDQGSQDSRALREEVVSALIGISGTVSTNAETLTRSNEQKLELLRTGVEQRLNSFTSESGRKADLLSQALAASADKLHDEVSSKLGEFRTSLEGTINSTHQVQRETTESVSNAISALLTSSENRQVRLQTVIEGKMTTLGQLTAQKLTDVEGTLRTQTQELRTETGAAFKGLGDSVIITLTEISQIQKRELQELRATIDGRLSNIQVENEKKLEQMRQTVDEKLQGTLEARLGDSFKQVSDRLEQVYKGLGEMQTLAAGVGDLKRVLTNVKTRGTWGEVQLGALLEQMLAPDQFSQNVATTGTGERVDYAIKLPGRESEGSPVWLPIDAKFPIEDYQRLVEASERGDSESVERASRQLEVTLKSCAKNLNEKYVAPPATTDFGILFLPVEGLYAEAVRRTGVAEFIQREYRIILAGPSTLAALLNSLQMGFRTLAIQKRSSEVWSLLGTVKLEFSKYADVLAKVKRKLSEAQTTIDKAETRTRAIRRKLRDVEGSAEPQLLGEDQAEGSGENEASLDVASTEA